MADREDIEKITLERFKNVREILAGQIAFDGDSASWAVAALDRFIQTERETLDDAFGLGRGAGRPAHTARRLALARKAQALRDQGLTWDQVADDFMQGGESVTDEKSIRGLVREFEVQLISDQVDRQIDAKRGET